jgi:hypothetical protein
VLGGVSLHSYADYELPSWSRLNKSAILNLNRLFDVVLIYIFFPALF